MADQVSDFLLKRLSSWGVKRIYGFPGDGINGIMGALNRAGDLIKFVQEQRAMSGDPKYEASQDLPDLPCARYAELLGVRGIFVDKPEQIGEAWEQAFAADRPVVLEAYTDPNVPTLPPHITLKEAEAYAKALIKGDPEEIGIIKQTFKDAIETVLPHTK